MPDIETLQARVQWDFTVTENNQYELLSCKKKYKGAPENVNISRKGTSMHTEIIQVSCILRLNNQHARCIYGVNSMSQYYYLCSKLASVDCYSPSTFAWLALHSRLLVGSWGTPAEEERMSALTFSRIIF